MTQALKGRRCSTPPLLAHPQVKNMVFSTPRGRGLLEGISRRALQEEWYGEALSEKKNCYTSDSIYK